VEHEETEEMEKESDEK
jgi:ATP-dependent Zn protease